MKVYCITLYSTTSGKTIQLASAMDLSSVSFFHRSTVQEHLLFGSKTVVERSPLSINFTVELKENFDYIFHTYIGISGLACCIVTDREYPTPIAYKLIHQTIDKFQSEDQSEYLTQLLIKSQNPLDIDKLAKIQAELDCVTDIMHKNIQDILERGETLDSLMEKSEDLSDGAKIFYREARRQNQCCKLY